MAALVTLGLLPAGQGSRTAALRGTPGNRLPLSSASGPTQHGVDLLPASVIVAVADSSWYEQYEYVPHYRWLTDSQLVYWKQDTDYRLPLFLLDTSTDQTRSLPGLTRVTQENQANPDFELSPEGSRLLFFAVPKMQPEWMVLTPDGQVVGSWKRHDVVLVASAMGPTSFAHWSADGSSVTESEDFFGNSPKPKPYTQVWSRPMSALARETTRPKAFGVPWGFYGDDVEIGNGRMLHVSGPLERTEPCALDLVTWNMSAPGKPTSKRLAFPKPNQVIDHCLSPDRRHIAWLCVQYRNRNWRTSTGLLSYKQISLWISGIDGAKPREVASMRCVHGDGEGEAMRFGELQWLPSGKALSYAYRGTIYRLALPGLS